MEKLTKKLNIFTFVAISFVVIVAFFGLNNVYAQSYDGGYDTGYDSGSYGGGYDTGYDTGSYGGSYDTGYSSGYTGSGYTGSGYDNYSGYGSYGGYTGSGYDNSGYGSYGGYSGYGYDNCATCGYTPPCTTCNYVPPVTPPCTTCNYTPPCTTCGVVPPVVIPAIVVSCSPNASNLRIGDSVNWYASVSGGTGSYVYSWTGTEGLSGGGSSVYKIYSYSGSKTARVTVTSGGQTTSADCGTAYVQDQQQNNDLTGSCYVDGSNVNTGNSVRWYATASGGNGSYTYDWSGDYPLSGMSGSGVNAYYNTTGTKYGSVTIRSNGQSITRSCGTVYVYGNNNYNNDLYLSCTVNNSNIALGQSAVWNTTATGGSGNYYYSWTGTDGLYSSGSSASKSYTVAGTKYATVTVTSNGQTKSLTCPTVVAGGINYQNPGNLASLSSVYLNQVPYTGVGDNPKFWAFIVGLFVFSGLGAYVIVFRKAKTERKNKILDFKNENMLKRSLNK